MLSKDRRVPREKFSPLFRGKVFQNKLLSLRIAPSPDSSDQRFSVVVSSKISNKAVERNKLRRRVYNILKDVKLNRRGFVAAFYAKKEAAQADFESLKQEVIFLVEKSEL